MALDSSTAILWHIFPLGALQAPSVNKDFDPDNPYAFNDCPRRTLASISVDHPRELGANALLLGPVFQSYSHGYDTVDHRLIDTRLGDRKDFDQLLKNAHDCSLAVVLDGVFNHVGSRHPFFLDACRRGADSPYRDFFIFHEGAGSGDVSYECFEGQTGLPQLNHDNPQVIEFIAQTMCYWLDAGIDGWRLDAAYSMEPRVWRRIVELVRAKHPDAWMMGEVIHGDYADLAMRSGWDTVTQYELWKAIWSSLNDANFHEFAWTVQRHMDFSAALPMQTFIGNHDVTRIASQLHDSRNIPLAVAMLMTMPGIPSIYYGDEVGLEGVKEERIGGDDAIRQEWPSDPRSLRLSERGARYWHIYSSLIAFRRRNPWLHACDVEIAHVDNTAIAYRCVSGDNAVTVVLNCSDAALGPDQCSTVADCGLEELAPHSYALHGTSDGATTIVEVG